MLFSLCGTHLDDWANAGSVDVFFMYGEDGLSSKGSNSYFR